MSTKKKIPVVLKHYEVPETLPAENFKAKCKYCAKEITGSVRTTTNWWKHIRRLHPTLLREEQNEDESQQTLTHLLQPQRKYNPQNPKQVLVTDAVVNFVADDLIPLSVVDSKRFKSLLSTLDPQYQLPSRKQLSTVLLKKKYDTLKSSVLQKLKKTDTINLTIDLWSNRQMRSYLGITGHYISDDWNLESVMLACNRVTGRHTGDNIMMRYEEIISDFGVREKVKHIITDSASNVKKAFLTLPGYEDVEEDHTTSECDDSEAEESERCGSINSFDESDEGRVLFEHHSCFAHVLQLVVKDSMAKAGQINSVIKRCSTLVSFVRRSTVATDVLKDETRLQADNTTSWNSQLKMIRSVLAVSDSVLSQVENVPKLTTHEKKLLQDMVDILTPFEEATEFVQVGCVPSAGYVLPCIRGLYHHIENMVSKYHSGLVCGLKQSLQKRMPYYEENETYIVAGILDPRFKLRWCSDDAERARSLDLLKAALERLSPALTVVVRSDENSEPPPKKKRKSLFNFMYNDSDSPSTESQQQRSTLTKQVEEYTKTDTAPMAQNPAKYWQDNQKKYPLLSRLAKDVLGVPSSSAPVERLFSIAGKVFTPERCCLTDSRFAQLMFIRCNQNYTQS